MLMVDVRSMCFVSYAALDDDGLNSENDGEK